MEYAGDHFRGECVSREFSQDYSYVNKYTCTVPFRDSAKQQGRVRRGTARGRSPLTEAEEVRAHFEHVCESARAGAHRFAARHPLTSVIVHGRLGSTIIGPGLLRTYYLPTR